MRYQENFTSTPQSPGAVRRFLRRHVPVDVDLDLVLLLATELATNALLHAATPFDVIVEVDDAQVRVTVYDADATLPAVVDRGSDATGGRGLRMVETGSTRWGAVRSGDGKEVWFAVDRPVGV